MQTVQSAVKRWAEVMQDSFELSSESRRVHNGLGIAYGDAMEERFFLQVAVDEGTPDPNLPQAKQETHILRAVGHEQGHSVPTLNAKLQEEVGHLIRILIYLLEGPATIFKQDCWLVGMEGSNSHEVLRYSPSLPLLDKRKYTPNNY